jgi:hypothetical protein
MHWKQEADRKANAFFDGVLPPFSNIGNTERGTIIDLPTLRGIGQFALISSGCGISTARGLMVAPCPKCFRSVHSTMKRLAPHCAGRAADFSTANPTSAYDTAKFGKVVA